ncbi:hypothetical protein M231_06687 [Tremella mesenterica]|uniref:EamA domain-containing protein n=1 Tax=Tremella mesenterica TaxID=5217 RepID=A0A4Q1BBB3_TREME|nr:hypothetical protein M231_06687 [Tremella mesenterica]
MSHENDRGTSDTHHLLNHPYAGVALVLLANSFFVLMDGTVQGLEVGYGVSAIEIAFLRMFFTGIATFIYLVYNESNSLMAILKPNSIIWWTRGAVNSSSLILAYTALAHMPLSDFITLFHLRPIPVALLCSIFLHEVFTWVQGCATVISFGAVILIVQPEMIFGQPTTSSTPFSQLEQTETIGETNDSFHPIYVLGVLFTLSSTLFSSVDVMLLRKIGKQTSPMILLLLYAICNTVLATLWMIASRTVPRWLPLPALLLLIVVSMAGLAAQLCTVLATQRETGSRVAILGYLQVVPAVFFQIAVGGSFPSLSGIVGMLLIIGAGTWSVLKGSPKPAPSQNTNVESQEIRLCLLTNAEERDDEDPPKREG